MRDSPEEGGTRFQPGGSFLEPEEEDEEEEDLLVEVDDPEDDVLDLS